jgi:dTDP-4-dehydrorhamnose reductase
MTRVLVTGARGMLGTALLAQAPPGTEVVGVDLPDGDLSVPGVAEALLRAHQPRVALHCAAWTDVDGCTADPEQALLHNGHATGLLAAACQTAGVRLLYISTDYVFPGDAGRPYVETDVPRPLNPYGLSKLAGEQAVATLADHVVVRTQWLYGPRGKSFVHTIVNAARTRPALRVVANEFGSPTYVPDLAAALWEAALSRVTGVIHLTNAGVCSWYELAREALRAAGLSVTVEPLSAADWPSPTRRPHFSPLASPRWTGLGHCPLRPWQAAVAEYVASYLMAEEAPPNHA